MNIRETLLEHGMDDNWIASKYRDIIDSSPPNAKLNALNRVSELLGHTRKEKEEKTQNIIMISDGDKKLLSEARQKLSDKDIGRLMNVVKNKGIQGHNCFIIQMRERHLQKCIHILLMKEEILILI